MKKWPIVLLSGLVLAACGGNPESTDFVEEGPDEENFNPEGMPIVDEPIELTFFGRRHPFNEPYDEMLVFQEYEEMTNIEIDWQDIPQEGFGERKQLEFTSNNLPDVFYRADINRMETIDYGIEANVFIPLNDLIDEYAPNIRAILDEYPEVEETITAPDGNIYSIPGIVTNDTARAEKIWINHEWLDAVGMDAPETQDEFVEVLTAFRDEQPGGEDTYPMMFRGWGAWFVFSTMYGLDEQLGYHINIEDDDTVNIWRTDERFREFLEFSNMMHEEGLLDQQLFSQEESRFVTNMNNGNIGIFINLATDAFQDVVDQYKGIAPIEGPHGDRGHRAAPIARDFGAFAITSHNEHPHETMRWLDYFYGDEGNILFSFGIEGETWEYDEDGEMEFIHGRGSTDIGQFTPWPGGGTPKLTSELTSRALFQEEDEVAQEALDPYLPEQVLAYPIFDAETAREVDELRQDIDPFFDESIAEFITGERNLDEDWDDYVSTLEQMGIDRLEEIFQEAYDDMDL